MLKPTIRLCVFACACLAVPLAPLRGQQPETAQANSAVVPESREGRPHERYLQLNRIVQENPGALDLVFIGDSITQGWETNGKEVWEKFYGRRKVLNLGISGDRTQHVLYRLENGNADGIRPRAAVLMIGTNNSADDRNSAAEMVEGVQAVVRKIQEKWPDTKILLLGIFPRGEDFNPQRGKILQVNQVIRKLADSQFVHYLDIGHLFVNDAGRIAKEIMPDFLHLTPPGYEIWAEAIEPKLKELLGEEPSAAAAAGAAGEWSLGFRDPAGEQVEVLMRLAVDGGRVTGTIESRDGRRLDIENGELQGNQLSFVLRRVRGNGKVLEYRVKGTVDGDQMRGTLNAMSEGQTVEWTARRGK